MKYLLSDIFEKPISGEWGKEANEDNIGFKVIRTTNFTNIGKLNLDDVVYRDIDENKYSNKQLKFGDIIIEKSGGSPKQPVGRVVIFEENSDDIYFCNNFTSILRPNEKVYFKYALYLMMNLYNRKEVLRYQNKTTGIINLKLSDYINNTSVDIPDIEIQKKIADILDKAQDLIEMKKEQIKMLDELVKSRFIEMFGDPVVNFKNWKKMLCKDVTSKIGSGATPKGGNSSYKEEGISLIRSMNVHNNKFIEKDLAFIDDIQAEKLKNVIIEENDVLINITGASVARCCIVPKKYIPARVNQHVTILRCKHEIILYIFLCYQLTNKSYQRLLKDIATSAGATREAITKQQIENLELIIPPMKLQNEFADFVNQVDKLKAEMNKSLKELEDNFNSLMQKAFKGELFE
ncbi:MAG: restriction endonuclease subunit S [Intestinibacter sp.]|uniref:restriction endonuclease subunit S n=1 Tax=Intestinibacter sp. TaxID=1965304 RepID=UPI003F18D14D